MKILKKLLSMGLLLSLVVVIGVIASPKAVKAVSLSNFTTTVNKVEKKLKKKNKKLTEIYGGTVYIKKGKSKKIGKHNKNTIWTTVDGSTSVTCYIDVKNKRSFFDKEENINLITVKKGKIKATKPGLTMVMSYNKKTKILTKYKICIKGIQYKKATMAENDTFQILCTDRKGLTKGFKYTSVNKKIASVSKKGVITAKSKGSTKIYATKGKGKNKVKYTMKVKVNNFGFYDKDGNKLPVLEGGVDSLYRKTHIELYTDDNFLDNITAAYVLEVEGPDRATIEQNIGFYMAKYKNTSILVPSYKNIVNTITVKGTSEIVDYDYDSAAKYDARYFNARIDKNGNVTGCVFASYTYDCSVCKVKVGNKYYLIEIIFNREEYEKVGWTSKKTCKAHDKILGDLTTFRKENDIVWYY